MGNFLAKAPQRTNRLLLLITGQPADLELFHVPYSRPAICWPNVSRAFRPITTETRPLSEVIVLTAAMDA